MAKLVAYCLKTKKKEEMQEAVVLKTAKGGYRAQGKTAEGHKISLMLSEEKANAAIAEGVATKGW